MKIQRIGLLALGLLAMLPALPAAADGPVRPRSAAEEQASFEADRRDILGMAGAYKVRFDMQEATAWRADYTPIEAKVSGGHEVVRVIEDSGRKIVLQHLLVVEHDGKSHVIKHWRQDWEYEPARVLVYAGPNEWKWEAVAEAMRRGRWSQTVYQVDDSPRYGGWGQWTTEGGVRRWRSNWTWRPLARRDAVRGPVYDRYLGINRHQPTPSGWVHWQDNTKMGLFDGKLQPVVQEYVLNSYTRFDGYDVKAADAYWAATKGYWAAIRAEWDRIANAKNGIRITEAAEAGTVIASRLLTIADEIQAGKTSEAAGIALAKKLMDQATKAA
ncbi:DUF6607 family protein [Sphingomonas sp. HT-1]|uniref:DUF6607 family protein n=1 Tax=unclassified Sphingomonas TaxID=196159 RepID=UPI0002E176BE|nr:MULTISPECIES: DUF6607 family protein [unclassified Sphingomonas]KTF70822.1 hypothetical protein ATB93_00475 [Sphingomonas sp. WG]